MATPVLESIALALQAQLQTITVANDYELDVVGAVRPRGRGDWWNEQSGLVETIMQDGLIVIEQGARTKPDDREVYDLGEYVQAFDLHRVVRASDTSYDAIDATMNTAVADIEKALLGSDSWWTTSVSNVWIEGDEDLPEGAPIDGRTVHLMILYRHNRGNPYTLGG